MKKPPQDLGGFMSGKAIYKTQQSEFIMHNSRHLVKTLSSGFFQGFHGF